MNHSLVLAFPSGKGPLMICGGVIPDSRQTSSTVVGFRHPI